MQAKFTLFSVLLIGFLWTTNAFAYVLGPDPAMNGIFPANGACNVAGCHTSFALNLPNGGVTVGGLPTTGWVPGQTYPLTVTISGPATQRVFGFQLSAVADATNQQAGTLTPGNGRVKVICGRGTAATSTQLVSCTTAGAIQYAEHVDARVITNPYLVNWTAPASASAGTIRFNVAGNAANGDVTNQGDYIYTNVYRISALDLSSHAFTMVDRGGMSVITDGTTDPSGNIAGYARILTNSGSTPSGVAIFGERNGAGTLVTEAGVPASALMQNGRIYAEVGAGGLNGLGTDIGLAIANPGAQAATISFTFTNTSGIDIGASNYVLNAGTQIAKFLDEAPWNAPLGFQGTFTFSSNVPISVVALEGFRNQRNEFLITTLPVIDTSAPTTTSAVVLPHYTDGSDWSTYILLVNPTDTQMSGTIQFRAQAGTVQPLTAGGQTANSFAYTIAGRSSFKLTTAGAGAFKSGTVTVTPAGGTNTPVALSVFSYSPGGLTVSQAGVPLSSASAFRMFVEGTPGRTTQTAGSYSSGIAVGNPSAAAVNVTFELFTLSGVSAGLAPVTVQISPFGQTAAFIEDQVLFPSLALPFQGVMRISASAPVSVVGLRIRYNERPGEFVMTTTPPTDENTTTTSAEFDFPHILNGLGFTTQFVLFSGAQGQTSSGNLKFFFQGGAPFNLNVN